MNYFSLAANIIHWLGIAFVTFGVLSLLFDPHRDGGDAATKGLGTSFMYIGMVILAILIVLKILPYPWAKYVGAAIVLSPLVFVKLNSTWRSVQYDRRNAAIYKQSEYIYAGKDLFKDKQQLALIKAIHDNDIVTTAKLLKQPFPLLHDYNNAEKKTVLDFVCHDEKNVDAIRLLLKAGAQLDSNDPEKKSTLMHNALNCSPKMFAFLLQQGANPNYTYHQQNAVIFEVLSSVIHEEVLEKIKLLIRYKADLNLKVTFNGNYKNISPLIWAAINNHFEVCQLLIQNGADENYVNPDGNSYKSIMDSNTQ